LDEDDIAYIIAHRKWKRAWYEYLSYPLLLVPFAAMCVCGYSIYSFLISPISASGQPNFGLFFFCVGFFIFFLAFLLLLLRRLPQNNSFTAIKTSLSITENSNLTMEIYRVQKNCRAEQSTNYIICYYGSSLFSPSGKITIIPLDKEILINSRPMMAAVSVFRDVQNIKRFKAAVSDRID
jgi:hypothetical protein